MGAAGHRPGRPALEQLTHTSTTHVSTTAPRQDHSRTPTAGRHPHPGCRPAAFPFPCGRHLVAGPGRRDAGRERAPRRRERMPRRQMPAGSGSRDVGCPLGADAAARVGRRGRMPRRRMLAGGGCHDAGGCSPEADGGVAGTGWCVAGAGCAPAEADGAVWLVAASRSWTVSVPRERKLSKISWVAAEARAMVGVVVARRPACSQRGDPAAGRPGGAAGVEVAGRPPPPVVRPRGGALMARPADAPRRCADGTRQAPTGRRQPAVRRKWSGRGYRRDAMAGVQVVRRPAVQRGDAGWLGGVREHRGVRAGCGQCRCDSVSPGLT
ncbi:hypothetical protein GAR06_01647 [Micromonospora saelicesensis]|nr:hypothetical protein GAR06_01647 [Micromonospora saelicesensis]